MKKIIIIFLFIIQASLLIAQQANNKNGSIRGFVTDKENGEPVMFCNVFLEGTTMGSTTNIDGMYNISKVPVGIYNLMITYIGFDTLKLKINVESGKILTKNLQLEKSNVQLNEVKISSERNEMKTEVKTASIKITKKDIEMIPTIGGEADIAQYIQVIPGVVFTGDQGGQLYIRGGSPIQNKVLLDGMIIYSPFHSIGLFSVFDTDIIAVSDIYTGGFSAKYGGRISSIMDIKTIDGNKKRIEGKLSSNTFGSKLFIQGPLSKNKSSFVFSGKTSYLDKSSDLLYKYPILYFDEKGLPYSFTDLYGKLHFQSKNGSKFNIFGFNFNDNVNYINISNLGWNSSGVGSEFILLPSNTNVLIEGNFAYSFYNIEIQENAAAIRKSSISGYNMGIDFTYWKPKGHIKYGFDIDGFSTNYESFNSLNHKIGLPVNTSDFSAYTNYQYKSRRFIFEPGLRIQYYGNIGASLEPRVGAKYIATEKLRIKASSGIYSQNILSTTSDRDVVSLFSGIISTDVEVNIPENKQKLQKANHAILGIEYDVNSSIDFQIEGYIKDFTQLININKNMLSEDDDEFIVEKGLAQGIDFLLKYKNRKLYLWTVYSLGYVTRENDDFKYPPHFDRRHNINFVSSYKFGKRDSWKSDLRWNMGSGFPFTQTQGFYENINFSQGINTDYTSANGSLNVNYDEVNGGRLPYYHRLDASISKNIKFNKKTSLDITASVTNLYNRQNIFYFNRVKYERIDQLPIMPSFGLSLKF